MSRLIVKNLPKSVTESKLKELFSQKGIVTDVQLKYTKEGQFRRFCFIGFKTEEEAQRARDYFNNTCIDTARITVEQCASLGDPSKPKSWSKYASDSIIHKKDDKDKHSENAVNDGKENKQQEISATSKGKSKKEAKAGKNVDKEIKEALEKHKNDPLFTEFLQSHAPESIKTAWDNDTAAVTETIKTDNDDKESDDDQEDAEEEEKPDQEDNEKAKVANQVISDKEYMEALKKKGKTAQTEGTNIKKSVASHGPKKFFTVKIFGLGMKHKKKHIKQLFRPLAPKSIRLPPKISGIAYVGFKTEQQLKKALLKHKSFLDGKQISVIRYQEKQTSEQSKEEQKDNSNVKWKKQEEALKEEENIAESGRIFLRNLAYTTTEDDIRKLFEKYGPLTEVNLPIDKVTRKPKGFGTATFLLPEHAVKCYMELDGSVLNGRMLHLLPGKAKASLTEMLGNDNLSFKQKKELKNKITASSSHNWNTLFLGQNAVAEAIAAVYNTTKEKVLEDASKGMSAAVKLALGETQLVQDTKKFLEEQGVRLDAFNQSPEKRSRTVILVKNLPAGTRAEEIRDIFVKHGELGRVVLPQSGITALVEFLEPSEARKGFTKLAYTKFKHLPLYLEWAPENIFTAPSVKPDHSNSDALKDKSTVESNVADKQSGQLGEITEEKPASVSNELSNTKEQESEDDDEPEPDTTLYVKNINFSTTDEELKQYFAKCGPIHYASIVTKKDPKVEGGKLSMGYGFVRYKRKDDADRALRSLQMTVLKDKTLELKRSERTLETDVKTSRKSSDMTKMASTKILVRNIPFQATAQEVTELFKAFGELKAVRLPKKLVGVEKHRGFAFVEYYTKKEAKRAFEALSQSTHLYGRRLALEWAQAEEDVEDIRKRTAKHFYQERPTKMSRKSTLDPEEFGLAEEENV